MPIGLCAYRPLCISLHAVEMSKVKNNAKMTCADRITPFIVVSLRMISAVKINKQSIELKFRGLCNTVLFSQSIKNMF